MHITRSLAQAQQARSTHKHRSPNLWRRNFFFEAPQQPPYMMQKVQYRPFNLSINNQGKLPRLCIVGLREAYFINRSVLYLFHGSWRLLRCFNKSCLSIGLATYAHKQRAAVVNVCSQQHSLHGRAQSKRAGERERTASERASREPTVAVGGAEAVTATRLGEQNTYNIYSLVAGLYIQGGAAERRLADFVCAGLVRNGNGITLGSGPLTQKSGPE